MKKRILKVILGAALLASLSAVAGGMYHDNPPNCVPPFCSAAATQAR